MKGFKSYSLNRWTQTDRQTDRHAHTHTHTHTHMTENITYPHTRVVINEFSPNRREGNFLVTCSSSQIMVLYVQTIDAITHIVTSDLASLNWVNFNLCIISDYLYLLATKREIVICFL